MEQSIEYRYGFLFFSFWGMFPCLSRDDNIGEVLCLVINKEANFKAEMCVGHMVYFFQAWGVFYDPKKSRNFFCLQYQGHIFGGRRKLLLNAHLHPTVGQEHYSLLSNVLSL